jgi:hypothetical protein
MGNGNVGDAVKPCPKTFGVVVASVARTDASKKKGKTSKPLKNVSFTLSETGAVKKSGGSGSAEFSKLPPKTYTVTAALADDQTTDFELVTTSQSVVLPPKGKVKAEFKAARLAAVRVHVSSAGADIAGAHVEISGPSTARLATGPDGVADFGRRPIGDYKIKITFPDGHVGLTTCVLPATNPAFRLARAQQLTSEVVLAERVVEVVPKLEVEYKVVPLDRGGSKYQESTEAKVVPDPTYVLLSVKPAEDDPKFTGGVKLTATPANIDVFTDAECTTKLDLSLEIANDKVTGAKPYKLYLRGTKKGKFALKLEVATPLVKPLKAGKAASVDMAVVDLDMLVHKQDVTALEGITVDPNTDPIDTYYTNLKDKKLPPQKALGDEEKVKQGRFLHAQKSGAFGRARLLFKKISSADWPDGCDGYKLLVNEKNTSGAVEIFDKEEEGTKKDFPVEIKVSDLKAKDVELWVEGKSTTTKACDVQLDVGLDRGVEPGQPAAEKRRYADFARFTVVEIKEVVLDYTPPPGKAEAWEEAKERFYVNLQTGDDGRKITLKATLKEKIKGATVHFALAPDKNNRKEAVWGVDMPSTWKWHTIDWKLKQKDKKKPEDLLHLSAVTDENGVAKVELMLSQFGGDLFQPAAYIVEDAHLAKYVEGNADLEKRKPVFSKKKIQVWCRFWYQLTKAKGFAAPLPAAAVTAYADVKTDMVHAETVEFEKASVPACTYYKEYMFKVGGSDDEVAVVGSHNKNHFFGLYVASAAQPVKNHLIACQYQFDEKWTKLPAGNYVRGTANVSQKLTAAPAGGKVRLTANEAVVSPPLQGGSMVKSCEWVLDSNHSIRANIPAGNVTIEKTRTALGEICVTVPGTMPTPTALAPVWVIATVYTAAGPYLGESKNHHSLIVYDPTNVPDYNDTVVHEIGHGFNQTPRDGAQPDSANIPKHPEMADRGQGNHCQVNDGVDAISGKTKYKCVMYDAGPMKWGLHKFCPKCHAYVLTQDMTKFG